MPRIVNNIKCSKKQALKFFAFKKIPWCSEYVTESWISARDVAPFELTISCWLLERTLVPVCKCAAVATKTMRTVITMVSLYDITIQYQHIWQSINILAGIAIISRTPQWQWSIPNFESWAKLLRYRAVNRRKGTNKG